ncbi:hypothetical protein VSQ48_13600 [Candidatus Ventrimonas sp. KK005]
MEHQRIAERKDIAYGWSMGFWKGLKRKEIGIVDVRPWGCERMEWFVLCF